MGSKLCSAERIVLECGSCGERTVLGGPEDVWLSGRTTFECECGRRLTLADRLGEDRPRWGRSRGRMVVKAGPVSAQRVIG